ncbi:MAG: hypothetical protein IKP28_04955 [Clostridia bacterium]|nr:hypothetical protein [Clostridia bacterium]
MSLAEDQIDLKKGETNALDTIAQQIGSAFNVIGAISKAGEINTKIEAIFKGTNPLEEGRTVVNPETQNYSRENGEPDTEALARAIGRDMSGR